MRFIFGLVIILIVTGIVYQISNIAAGIVLGISVLVWIAIDFALQEPDPYGP